MSSPFSSSHQTENAFFLAGVPAALIGAWQMVAMCFLNQVSDTDKIDDSYDWEDVEFSDAGSLLPEIPVNPVRTLELFEGDGICGPIDEDSNYAEDNGDVCFIIDSPPSSASVLMWSMTLLTLSASIGGVAIALRLLRQKKIPNETKAISSIHSIKLTCEDSGDGGQSTIVSPVSVQAVDSVESPAVTELSDSIRSTDKDAAVELSDSSHHSSVNGEADDLIVSVNPIEDEALEGSGAQKEGDVESVLVNEETSAIGEVAGGSSHCVSSENDSRSISSDSSSTIGGAFIFKDPKQVKSPVPQRPDGSTSHHNTEALSIICFTPKCTVS